jgi:hypothetical protein
MSNDQNRRARLLVSGQFLFTMRYLFVAVLISFVLVVYASAIELFRYNLTTPDGRTFQYSFDVSDPAFQSARDALSREEIVNRAMGWMVSVLPTTRRSNDSKFLAQVTNLQVIVIAS